jgi:quercetin dioxygenase-like cupin family protein
MTFVEHQVKGIDHCFLDADLNGEPLHVHISEVGPGERSHPPHRHGGIEAFYMLQGEGTLEIDGETQLVKTNEVAVFDPQKLHGLVNTGNIPMRYMVIIYRGER